MITFNKVAEFLGTLFIKAVWTVAVVLIDIVHYALISPVLFSHHSSAAFNLNLFLWAAVILLNLWFLIVLFSPLSSQKDEDEPMESDGFIHPDKFNDTE